MANKSVLELAVGTGSWDAGLKKAKQALDNFTQAQGGLQKALNTDSDKMQQFVRMMGQMDSTAKTAKGQLNDYKGTIETLTMQYNRMTEAQKKTIGQDYLQAIDAMKQKYQAVNEEIKAMNQSLNGAKLPDAPATGGGGLFGGSKLDGMLQVFGGNLMTKGASMLAGLAADMGDMVTQGIEMAKAGEGIRIAFERLNQPGLLDNLREATHGTVTNLELMKAAVKFNDFKLPVEELGTMLAFAQQKAKDTGQSVDYMVDSIVTGLGRKSLMILDNLGLSAAEIKEKMAETGDMTKAVGEIIREQMSKAGDYVETAADRAAQANVNMQNKMEELGRKFAPLEEASNSLWASMKIGILDIIGGPLTDLLNKLTEAGRLASAYGVLGGNAKVGRMTTNLAGAKEEHRQAIYQQQQQQFWKYINPREQQIKDIRAWQSGQRGEALQARVGAIRDKYGSLDATKIQAEVDAAKKMLADYQQAAKGILTPVKADIDTSGAVQSVETLKVKLAELEAQRKKAVASGDNDRVKTLTQQINQTKTNIKALSPDALKTTHTATPQERAASKVQEAERTYTETLLKNSIRLEAGIDTTLENKKKELSAQERLFDAYNDAYATYKDPKYKEASAEAATKIKTLATEVKSMEDAVKASKVKWEQGLSGFNAQTMQAWMSGRQSDLSKAEYGSADYSGIMANIADMNAIKTVLEQSMKAGIDAAQFDLEPLWEKVFDGENIPDGTWQSMIDTINEKLKELHLEPIQLDFQTGNVKSQANEMAKDWQAAGTAIQAVGSAMSQIEDPAAKVMGTIAQAIATIALTFASSLKGTFTPWDWIAAAATGTATMISTIAAIHSATGYATGGVVKGSSYSGDSLLAQGPDGGMIGLNAGEVVLNRAQAGVLASAIQDNGGGNGRIVGVLRGEDIALVADRWGRRTGKGELAFFK